MDKNEKDDKDENESAGNFEADDEWTLVNLDSVTTTTPFGFVINHFAYWGIALPGFPEEMQASQAADPATAPKKLKIKDVEVETDKWSGGDFSITATRTPPLFHAYHHKTDESRAPMAFERRSETNITERNFTPRNPLTGKGREACVQLLDVTFNASGSTDTVSPVSDINFTQFDTRAEISNAISEKYFETREMAWDTATVGPLNALWFVIFKKGSNNQPIGRLEDGYRLWHQLDHKGNTEGYDWKILRKNGYKNLKVEVRLSGALNNDLKDCPDEDVTVKFELEWQ